MSPHSKSLPAQHCASLVGFPVMGMSLWVSLFGFPWKQGPQPGLKCRWNRDGESETDREGGHPRMGEILNKVPLWMTEAQHHRGPPEKLCRLFLKIVPWRREGQDVPAWAGWHFVVMEKSWGKESGRRFRNLRWEVMPSNTVGLRSVSWRQWCGAQTLSALGGRSCLDGSVANIRPHCAQRLHIHCNMAVLYFKKLM